MKQVSVKQLRQESNQMPETVAPEPPEKKVSPADEIFEPPDTRIIEEITKDNVLGADTNLKMRKEMIEAMGFEPAEFAYERAIGRNDSLYSNFVELIALTKRKVGRIVVNVDGKRAGFATGFMVSPRVLLTNWHVFRSVAMAEDSEVHFFYEFNTQGHPASPVVFKFDTNVFFNNQLLDYCFVAVKPSDITGKVSLASIGYLFLDKSLGKIGEPRVERLNIIHHPQGDLKQISIRENLFVDINDTKIFYETDTAPGSSGSPVFNDQWQVVGLHHRSVAKMTADEKNYLDKDDRIIPVIAGTIDFARIVWLKNEGMRISVVLNHLLEMNPGNETVAAILTPPLTEQAQFLIGSPSSFSENQNIEPVMNNTTNNEIKFSVPVNAINTEKTIDISFSSRSITGQPVIPANGTVVSKTEKALTEDFLLEIAKVDKENAVDFSKCRGYETDFLGVDIPLPQPKKLLEKQVALLKNKSNELKYFKYSVIFNAVRHMPIISAVNVEGDPDKRKDNSKRKDDWLRDVRIDVAPQLTDKFYAGSQMDKGHMSRFEDANWDNTEELAKRNGIYTCFYTNASPQVMALNRGGGLWGQLEKQVLEKGIKKEAGKLARMSVFNGPIFNDEIDRPYLGVTVPMQFFKIICWLNDEGKLKVTAFKLSQEMLVDHIQFDELIRIDDMEALDIDKVTKFRKFQCTVKSLSTLAKIDFDHLEKFDTFKPTINPDETEISSGDELML